MSDIERFVRGALSAQSSDAGKHGAFGELVARFQDMAFGYAYSLVGDITIAEEAAQEAFICAWQRLHQLRDPAAFPAWFKRIVFTQCCRLTRRQPIRTVSFEECDSTDCQSLWQANAQSLWEEAERRTEVHRAIGQLPEGERVVIVLFYINEYSRAEIAGFLGITEEAVKKRLASARRRMKEGMIFMVQDDLHARRPSQGPMFQQKVLAFCQQFGELLRDGAPILKTLEMCAAAQADSPRFQQAVVEMRQTVMRGEPLIDVMSRYEDFFPAPIARVISLGEEKGTLEIVLDRLARGASFAEDAAIEALKIEMQSVADARRNLPNVMAHFPHLFREGDLTAVRIGEQTGLVDLAVQRLACGENFDTEANQQAFRERLTALRERIRLRSLEAIP